MLPVLPNRIHIDCGTIVQINNDRHFLSKVGIYGKQSAMLLEFFFSTGDESSDKSSDESSGG